MEQKQKVLFNILNTFLLKSGCEEMSVELDYSFDLWNGNKFYCRKKGQGETIPSPIPIAREISEYVEQAVEDEDAYYTESGEDFYQFEFIIHPKERLIEVIGSYSLYGTEDFTEEVFDDEDSHMFDDPDILDEIFEYLEDSGSDILDVRVDAGGDSGWIEDTAYDVNGRQIDVTQEMKDVGYKLLNKHPGWEINEGSTSMFTWDPQRKILIFKFAYNTEEQGTEVIRKESF